MEYPPVRGSLGISRCRGQEASIKENRLEISERACMLVTGCTGLGHDTRTLVSGGLCLDSQCHLRGKERNSNCGSCKTMQVSELLMKSNAYRPDR